MNDQELADWRTESTFSQGIPLNWPSLDFHPHNLAGFSSGDFSLNSTTRPDIFPLFCVPSSYIHMTFFFFQGPNSSFLICTYIHAHPHTHSLIDTLTDHTHSHVTHTHHAHTHTHTHTLKYSLPPCIITQTLHTHTHPPDTHHTHIHSHRHTQQATTDTYHTQVFEHPARHWGYNSE